MEEQSHNLTICRIDVIGILEGEEIENRAKEILEVVMAKNFPKLMTDTKVQIQEAWRISSRVNIKNLYQAYHPRIAGN